MKNKSFLKKTEHCLGIIVNVFAILGISVLGGKSLIKDESERYLSEEETRIFEEESVFLTNSDYENDSLNIRNTQSNQEQGQDENLNKEYENTDTKAGRTLITGEQLWKAQRTDDHKQKRPE